MGAFFEPKALCGSRSGGAAGDCGAGRGASLAATTGEGRMGDSDAGEGLALSVGNGASGCGAGEVSWEFLWNEGRNRAHKPSTVTLPIATKMRRGVTRSSEAGQAVFSWKRQMRILPRNERIESGVRVQSSSAWENGLSSSASNGFIAEIWQGWAAGTPISS